MSYPPSVPVDTSAAAAAAIAPKTPSLRLQVLAYVRHVRYVGAMEEDIERHMGLDGNTIRPRVWELLKTGAIIDSGHRRNLRSGRKGRVLICPEFR